MKFDQFKRAFENVEYFIGEAKNVQFNPRGVEMKLVGERTRFDGQLAGHTGSFIVLLVQDDDAEIIDDRQHAIDFEALGGEPMPPLPELKKTPPAATGAATEAEPDAPASFDAWLAALEREMNEISVPPDWASHFLASRAALEDLFVSGHAYEDIAKNVNDHNLLLPPDPGQCNDS